MIAASVRSALGKRSRILALVLAVILAAIGSLRVAATYRVFSNTMDEPIHIAAGMEWWERGTFRFAGEHPPLGRIFAAAAPYAAGLRIGEAQGYRDAGREVLYAKGRYSDNLALARLGILPFFLFGAAGVWVWGRRLFGGGAALVGVGLFTTTPPVLAHAGLATTDMPVAGTLVWAIMGIAMFLDRPSLSRGAVAGLTTGIAAVSKMSAAFFLPACTAALLVARWVFRRPDERESEHLHAYPVKRSVLLAGAVALLVVWAVYRFTIGRRLTTLIPGGVLLLAPDYFGGVGGVTFHNAAGHGGFLLGEFRTTGWWYFFPVAVAVKTPIAMLVLSLVGGLAAVRHARASLGWQAVAPIAAALAMLVVSMPAKINVGVRHVLPMYALLAITAGYGAMWLWNRPTQRLAARVLAGCLLAWQAISTARAHPDYLAYFNELAGSHPERILLDSDLDWGQDLLRLGDTVTTRRLTSVTVAYFGTADVARAVPNVSHLLMPGERATGWVAISEMFLSHSNPDFAGYRWLREHTPVAQVGKSIKLFYVAP